MFIPNNLENRIKDFRRIQIKELSYYDIFVNNFKNNLKTVKNKKNSTSEEQTFIDLISDGIIKTNQHVYPFSLFIFKEYTYILEYDWKYNVLYYNTPYDMCQKFINNQLEKYFNIRPSIVSIDTPSNIFEIEELFKKI